MMLASLIRRGNAHWILSLMMGVLLLTSCAGSEELLTVSPTGTLPPGPAVPALPVTFGDPPATWTLTGSSSLYARLFRSTEYLLDIDAYFQLTMPREVLMSVAADLVVQLYPNGTGPLLSKPGSESIYSKKNDLVVWRTDDLIPIPPIDLVLGVDSAGVAFNFNDVVQFVEDAVLKTPDVACAKAANWWLAEKPPAKRLVGSKDESIFMCLEYVNEVRQAVQAEYELHTLRQDLSLIAYGEEFVWDGELQGKPEELRTYDLLLDIAGAGNILGSAPFQVLFDEGNQGEQCDDPKRCPQCLLPGPHLCGSGGVQGGEQCDDRARVPGDGCDEFCQVEGGYCGNANKEDFEACDIEDSVSGVNVGNECPNGMGCSDFSDCMMEDNICGGTLEHCMESEWERTCHYSRNNCDEDSDCGCPSWMRPAACAQFIKGSCRYAFDGICYNGNIPTDNPCNATIDCALVDVCINPPPGSIHPHGHCRNHPYKTCSRNEHCYSCSAEEILGQCYVTGEECNGNEDCPTSGYCQMDVSDICRPRTKGGVRGDTRSSCNEFCEDITRCGDRVTYLTETGGEEQCDDGMHCEDGTPCARSTPDVVEFCADGSACIPRDPPPGGTDGCDKECQLQVCGDRNTTGAEECDPGPKCADGSGCNIKTPWECERITDPNLDKKCVMRDDDNDGCSQFCTKQYCGDGIHQSGLGEECDDGGYCDDNKTICTGERDCPNYQHCAGLPARRCTSDIECPAGVSCRFAFATSVCTTRSEDGCSASCALESCGDGTTQDGPNPSDPHEQCDEGPYGAVCLGGLTPGADCSNDPTVCASDASCTPNLCKSTGAASCSNQCKTVDCGNGVIDAWGPDCDPDTKFDNEQCDDGNTTDGDGCNSSCQVEGCGNGIVEAGEDCEPKETCTAGPNQGADCSTSPSVCTYGTCDLVAGKCADDGPLEGNVCGGNADCESSPCDTTKTRDPNCTPDCRTPQCGDCKVDGGQGESCEDGNTTDGDGCNAACEREVCGDGTIQAPNADGINEACDPDPPDDLGPITPLCCDDPPDPGDPPDVCCSPDDLEAGTCEVTCNKCRIPNTVCLAGSCQFSLGCSDPAQPACPKASPSCGDGCVDVGFGNSEQCDGSPGCLSDCTYPVCGDNTVEGLEQCDPPDGQTCSVSCKNIVCGDCKVEPWESCEDGNTNPDDGCFDCHLEQCGDGRVQIDEQCDLSGICEIGGGACHRSPTGWLRCDDKPAVCSGAGGACSNDFECGVGGTCAKRPTICKIDYCGSGCSAACQNIVCGNDVTECEEECDDNNTNDEDGCNASCMWEFCGDGIKQDGPNPDDLHEECDDGAGNSDTVPGACKTDCTVGGCGDGILDPGEQCDVPTCLNGTLCKNNSDCGGERCLPRDGHGRCNSSCEKEKCGDNIVHSMYGEECDDGNTFNDDGCSRLCKVELFSCGDGIVQALGLDGAAGVKGVDDDHDKDSGGGTDEGDEKWWPGSDDEECDYAAPSAKECPGGGAVLCTMEGLDGSPGFAGVDDDGDGVIDDPSEHLWPDSDDETCNLGACNLASDTCLFGGFRCESDADCITPCITTCTESCRKKVNLCGDGYRENGEQCDDGNRTNGDGCSMYCEADRLDLCGNGVVNVAVGEECDQGHLLSTLECTPYCRNPNPAPMCGDGHKDPSGEKRADTLERLLTLSEGYRLDWRAPDGGEVIYPSIDGFDRDPSVWKTIGAGGMYVAPRVFERKLDTPFLQKQKTRLEHDGPRTLDQSKCSLCGNAVLDGNEQCDSGRLSGGSYPNNRVNDPAWRRSIWAWSFSRYVAPYYWNSYYWNIFPYNGYAYEHLISNWYYYRLNWRDYSRLLGRIGWLANGIKDDEGRKFVRENCSGSCRLQLCGNDRIDDGETCDDNNRKFFGGPQDGDGCSNKCVLEEGFKFNGPIIWPNGVIKPITCGDDVISFGEQCDHGGVCERRDGKQTGQYCRLEPGRFFDFCTKNGYDDIFGNDDDHVKCAIVGGNGCDANCQMSPTNICGNSRLEPYEECDNGKQCTGDPRKSCSDDSGCATIGGTCEVLPGDGCDTNCKLEPPGPASCGNGHLDQNGADGLADTGDEEECDAGSAAPTTHCDAFCQRIDGVCGDGKREGAEQCDDGNTTDGDACTNCLFPYCGDDRVDKDEECDDGNMIAKDGCSFCTVDLCGNGRIESGETCDDNNQTSGDGCSEWCILENVCGNGEIEGTEQCDDGNAFSNDGCSGSDRADEGVAACQWEYCGDDIVQPGLGEECDEGEFPPYEKGCSLDCRLPVCGDDIIDDVDLPFPHPLPLAPERRHYKEVCDPGKHCSNDNSIECDDGFECPLGPCNLGDGTCTGAKYKHCTTDLDCGFASCIVVGTAACSAQCTEPVKCGDGFIQGEEQCEPPGTLGCDTECMLKAPEKCGDTRVDTGEDCDDGNRSGHDGCSSTCQTESMKCDSGGGCTNPAKRFVCENGSYCLPSIGCDAGPCTLRPQCGLECVFGICGDKTTDPGEQCDDGRHCVDGVGGPCNTHGDCTNSYCLPVSGDGCSSTCQHEDNVETYYLLRLCQEEVTGFSGQAYQGKIRIGEGQREIWQDTLLHPQGNPFIETSHFFGARHLGTSNYLWWNYTWRWWDTEIHQSFVYHPWSWYWGSRWWPGDWYGGWSTWWGGWSGWWSAWYQNCPSGAFPNSLGNLVQSISGCIDSVSHSQTLPNRARVMPFQPVGLDSYPACQEPRAQLASAVEIPALPPVFIAPYEPSELARDLTTFICQRSSGLTRQAFVFFCEPSERAAPPRYMSDLELLDSQNQDIERELWLSHTLTIGYRASERDLNQYLSEAFAALSSVIKTAVELIDDLQRIKLTDKSCPMDADLTFCTAP